MKDRECSSNPALKRGAPLKLYIKATGLRTALRRGDLDAELPHLAGSSLSWLGFI